MHIHVNMDLILKVLDENVDEEGNVSWLDFIESILSSINQAFVGITNLQLSYDENKNTYFVLDENSTLTPKDFGRPDPDPTEIIVGIVKEGKGSFVLDASIDSQITNKLSSQLAIGAQASGQDIGANTVAISKWNAGLTDRIIPNKVTPYENDLTPELALNSSFDQEKLIELLGRYLNFSINNEEISELKSLGKTYITSRRDIDTNKGDLISRFFIPISLNLTLDGIAGPKLFQKYTINDIILPKNYQDNIEFIIKGISHKVDKNGWTTELESLSVPKPKGSYKSTPAQTQTPANTNTNTNTNTKKSIKTAYPEKPLIDPAPPPNLMGWKEAKDYLVSKFGTNLAKAAFCIIWLEANKKGEAFSSAGGYNYAGVQTDGGRWPSFTDSFIIGRYVAKDSKREREFAVFSNNRSFLDFIGNRASFKFKDYASNPTSDNFAVSYINLWWAPGWKANKEDQRYKDVVAKYRAGEKRFDKF